MMGGAPRLFGIVSFAGALLAAIAGVNRRIYIQGVVVEMQLAEEPSVQPGKYPVVVGLIELGKIALKGFMPGHTLKSP